MKLLLIALLLTILVPATFACGSEAESTPEGTPATPQATTQATPLATPTFQPSGDSGSRGSVEQPSSSDESDGAISQSSSSSEDDDDTNGQANGDSDGDSDDDSGNHDNGDSDDDVISRENPGFTGKSLDFSRNEALKNAESSRLLIWTWEAHIKDGGLQANGRLSDGAQLFDPLVDGDGAGFVLYNKDLDEPLVLLLPDLGPTHIWETDHTVAEMEHEFEGDTFSIRAYSPLFMDVGPNDLVIRVFGVNGDGNDAVLAVAPVAVP